jgi:hypothetical protein
MNKFLPIIGLQLLLFLSGSGCSDQKADDDTKVPLEVKEAESMDSTRLDSAVVDTTVADSVSSDASGR